MTRAVPHHVHDFDLTRISSSAVTYHLRPSARARDGVAYHCGGWAIATVNDRTGELVIQSDWGNWSHRWNVNHLGTRGPFGAGAADGDPGDEHRVPERRLTLTEFIGERDPGHCDYLANKLSSRGETDIFDAEETIRALRRRLVEQRIEAARAAIETYRDDPDDERPDVLAYPPSWLEGREVYVHGTRERWQYSRENVRSVYDALGELEEVGGSSDLFYERFFAIAGHALVTDEPWEYAQHRPSSAYLQLLHGILPALVRACAAQKRQVAMELLP